MKKAAAVGRKPVPTAKRKTDSFAPLIVEVRNLIQSARHAAASTVNTLQVMTNFEIGRRIVEHEQKGRRRAEYGATLLKELSARLTEEFGRGFSEDNLSFMRRFFLTWRSRLPEFPNSLFGNCVEPHLQKPNGKSQILQNPPAELPRTQTIANQPGQIIILNGAPRSGRSHLDITTNKLTMASTGPGNQEREIP